MNHNQWKPPVDLYRTPQGWALKLDLAGVGPADVEVELKGRDLYIRGVRRDSLVKEGWQHYSMEIEYDRFERVIRLPRGIQNVSLARDFRDGMLLIQIKHREGGSQDDQSQ